MKDGTEIVAATLLKVWETQGLLDTILFAAAGDAVAGLAGSYVGAALAPKNLKLRWRLLQEDGFEYTVTLKGGDPRNDRYDLLPSIEDYKEWKSDSMLAAAEGYDSSSWAQTVEPTCDGGTTIGAGTYRFGVNIPDGVYDLELLSGSGTLTFVDVEGYSTNIYMDNDKGARSYKGLSSVGCSRFELSGNLVLSIERARMLNV